MKFNTPVMLIGLSIFLVLTLIVCVSVYAFNASAYKNVSKGMLFITGSMNNHGLDNGYFSVHARIAPPGTTVSRSYGPQNYNHAVTAIGSASLGGYASAYVDGYDSNQTFHSRYDSETH